MLSLDERSETAKRGMGPYGEITNEKKPRAGRPRKRDTDGPSRGMRPPKALKRIRVGCCWDPTARDEHDVRDG